MEFCDFRNYLAEKRGERNFLEKRLKDKCKEIAFKKRSLKRCIKAQKIVQEVSRKTQENIVLQLEGVVNKAVEAVFPGEYEFKISFITKRNKAEVEMYLLRDSKKYDPLNDNGGGLVDIISFSLRLALLNLKIGPKLFTIILDEPFRFLDKSRKLKAGDILRELSEKLKIQFIIVTHDIEISESADKVFCLKKDGSIHEDP